MVKLRGHGSPDPLKHLPYLNHIFSWSFEIERRIHIVLIQRYWSIYKYINISCVFILSQKGDDMNHLMNDTDHLGCTPMHYATRDGNIKSVQGLLDWGATVKLKNKDKQSPLHFAAKWVMILITWDVGMEDRIINDTFGFVVVDTIHQHSGGA